MKNRREFLKEGTFGCAALMLGAMGATSLEGCKTPAVAAQAGQDVMAPKVLAVDGNSVKIPVADLKDINAKVVDINTGQKLLVNKNADGTYTVMEYKCPHAGGPLEKQGETLVCPWHNSIFTLEGKKVSGPTKTGLTNFPATVENGEIVVKLW